MTTALTLTLLVLAKAPENMEFRRELLEPSDRPGVRRVVKPGFVEVAAGVHVLRYPVLDVNAVLVVGEGEALLVDTLSTAAQAGGPYVQPSPVVVPQRASTRTIVVESQVSVPSPSGASVGTV